MKATPRISRMHKLPTHWSDKTVKIGYSCRYTQLTITKLQSQVRLVYDTRVYPHGTRPHAITDQITDHYAPYCDDLGYSAIDDIRVLAVIRCRIRSRTTSPVRH